MSEVDVGEVLVERGKRYGLFKSHAEITQTLKDAIYGHIQDHNSFSKMTPSMYEAIDMICHKLGRIANGDPHYADSWVDIAGYAKLVADELQGDLK